MLTMPSFKKSLIVEQFRGITWPTYIEIIGHLKAISLMRQFPDCLISLGMSLSSNINCCVLLCNQRGTVDANGKRVGFFNFPKDPNLRAQWLQKIQRDVGTKFKLTEITKVCSLHFCESEIKKGLGGKKMTVDITAVPRSLSR